MSDENGVKAMGQVIQIDEARIRDHLGEMVRGAVEETLARPLLHEGNTLLVCLSSSRRAHPTPSSWRDR